MAVPFPDIDPYEELKIDSKVSPSEIKKLYYKLCLKYHPDKLSADDKEDQELIEKFQKIQFSYNVLSDINRRKKYDQTGSLEDGVEVDGDFNWKDYFDGMDEITPDKIEQDKVQYQGSLDEETDLIEMYQYYDGDFIKLFESIPHSELAEDEERFLNKVEDLIADGQLQKTSKFSNYVKNRDKIKKRELKKLVREAKELEELSKMLNLKKKPKTMDDLSLMIQNRNNKRAADSDAFFDRLEAKYGGANKKQLKKLKK